MLSWIYWNPDRFAFNLPIVDRPVAWYGIFFVAGILLAYFIVEKVFERYLTEIGQPDKKRAYALTDKFTWFVIGGTIIGARLGHVLFYQWPYFKHHPFDIFKVWEGGLASHGGAVGILIALALFRLSVRKYYPTLTFIRLMDAVVLPTPLVAAFIRIGNFINQEILGTPSDAPWAVKFGNPLEGGAPLPRHPVQLYEAFAYLVIFTLLFCLWHFKRPLRKGVVSGLFLILAFGARFFLEYFKDQRGYVFDETYLLTGQLLSIPFILLGILVLFFAEKRDKSV